jgi:hypothetical protein
LLGDAALDAWPTPDALLDYARRLGLAVPAASNGWSFFADSGVAVWRDARQYLLADVGPVGPPHLAGHGHCDSLSFEWHVDGVPLLVDSGTCTYEIGADRLASRDTRAHNTLEIDGREQHEIWAAFRVARRATVHAHLDPKHGIHAELFPWHDPHLRVTRQFAARPDGMRIEDAVLGSGRHRIVSRLHLHPDCTIIARDATSLRIRHGVAQARIEFSPGFDFELLDPQRSQSHYCAAFGEPIPNVVVEISWQGSLPWRSEIALHAE